MHANPFLRLSFTFITSPHSVKPLCLLPLDLVLEMALQLGLLPELILVDLKRSLHCLFLLFAFSPPIRLSKGHTIPTTVQIQSMKQSRYELYEFYECQSANHVTVCPFKLLMIIICAYMRIYVLLTCRG